MVYTMEGHALKHAVEEMLFHLLPTITLTHVDTIREGEDDWCRSILTEADGQAQAKAIIRLDADEVALLLDFVENCGNELSGQALNYYKKTKDRDLAILTLLLGTGIRVSECVGLDLTDVDFKNNGITVTRKGGNQMVVYFGEEVEKALKHYIEGDRKAATPLSGHENALFLSTQKRRMGIQAVENMVKKYARQVTPTKKITPHKLRSTYGTSLYKETGDIYLVADVLGHKDVNTTKKHYAAIDEDRRRKAASAVKLRES